MSDLLNEEYLSGNVINLFLAIARQKDKDALILDSRF